MSNATITVAAIIPPMRGQLGGGAGAGGAGAGGAGGGGAGGTGGARGGGTIAGATTIKLPLNPSTTTL